MKRISLFTLAVSLLSVANACGQLPERFVTAWSGKADTPVRLTAWYTSEMKLQQGDDQKPRITKRKYLIDHESMLVAFLPEDIEANADVLKSKDIASRSPRYSFYLTHSAVPAEHGFLLTECSLQPEAELKKLRGNVQSHIQLALDPYVVAGGISLRDLHDKAKYTIISVSKSPEQGNQLTRVSFRCHIVAADGLNIEDGFCDIDETDGYICRNAQFVRNEKGTRVEYVVKTTYALVGNAHRILERDIVGAEKSSGKSLTWSTRYSYDSGPVNPSVFTLSHYGLPEPEGSPPLHVTTTPSFWLLISAGVFVVLAILGAWQLRRMRARRSTR